MEILGDGTSFIPLDRQIEVTGRTRQRRGCVGPFHTLAVDRGMDVEKVSRQHVQCGAGRQFETKGLRVVRVRLDVHEFVRIRRLSLDAGGAIRSHGGIVRDPLGWCNVRVERT